MAAFTSKATGNWDAAGQTTWNEVGTPGAGDDVTIQNTHVVTQVQNEACAGIVVDGGGEFDIATFNLANSSTSVFNGLFTAGTSADTGLTTTSVTFGATGTRAWEIGSKINCAGNWIEPNADISANNERGTVVITGSGNMAKPSSKNRFYSFTKNAGATTTAIADCRITESFSKETIINGIMDTGGFNITLGASSAIVGHNFTVGVNGDFAGAGNLFIESTCQNMVNNRLSAFSMTGTAGNPTITGIVLCIPAWDFSNADFTIIGGSAGITHIISAGTLKCKKLLIKDFNNNAYIINNSTNNASFVISGDFIVDPGTGGFTYLKGTGTITKIGAAGTQTWNLNNQLTEEIIQNSAGATLQFTAASRPDYFNLIAGTVDHNGQNMTTAGNYTIGVAGIVTRTGLNGMILTVGGAYSVTGSSSNQQRLDATATWTLTVTGSGTVTFADVKNSDASGGSIINANGDNCFNKGSNLNWDFSPAGGIAGIPSIRINRLTQIPLNF